LNLLKKFSKLVILPVFQTAKNEVREIAILVDFGNFLALLVLVSFVAIFCHHFVTAKLGPVRQIAGRQKVYFIFNQKKMSLSALPRPAVPLPEARGCVLGAWLTFI
jgi:hypothetical protein